MFKCWSPQTHLWRFVVLKNFRVCVAGGILFATILYHQCILLHSSYLSQVSHPAVRDGSSSGRCWAQGEMKPAGMVQPRCSHVSIRATAFGIAGPPAANVLLCRQRRLETVTSLPLGEQEKLQQCSKSWEAHYAIQSMAFLQNRFYQRKEKCSGLWRYYDIWNIVCITWQCWTQTKC